MLVAMTGTLPASTLDPFSEQFLLDPYPAHDELREAGPAVLLERYGVWAMARHDEVQEALGDWETYRSGAGVGLADFTKETPWRPPSLLLEADPPAHDRARKAIAAALSPKRVRDLHDAFAQEAEALVDRLVSLGRFDAMADLAQAYPSKIFPDAVGVPDEGRENLIAYGTMVFNAFGPRNDIFERSARRADEVREWIVATCRRENLRDDGLGAAVYEHAPDSGLGPDEAALLVRSLLSAGIDTTVHALGNAILCFATYPDQWAALHAGPGRSRAAFEEVLRFESPVQTFFRTTTREVEVDGVTIPRGRRCCCSSPRRTATGAAGRTPSASTSRARPRGTSRSARGSMRAWAGWWPAWRASCCWGRSLGARRRSSSTASPSACSTTRCVA
jgi:cytochrome P450